MPHHLDAELDGVLIGGREPIVVVIVDYDERRRALFDEHRRRITGAVGPRAIRVNHVGSTAVPDLAAPVTAGRPSILPDVDAAIRHNGGHEVGPAATDGDPLPTCTCSKRCRSFPPSVLPSSTADGVPDESLPRAESAVMALALGGFTFTLPVGTTLVLMGRRDLAAVDVGLMMLLQSVLGPLWAWVGWGSGRTARPSEPAW